MNKKRLPLQICIKVKGIFTRFDVLEVNPAVVEHVPVPSLFVATPSIGLAFKAEDIAWIRATQNKRDV